MIISFDEVYPLWCATERYLGEFDTVLSSSTILHMCRVITWRWSVRSEYHQWLLTQTQTWLIVTILTGAASVAFGFSTTFAMAIILRFFVGFLNGTPHNLHFCLQHFIALFHSREWWCSQSVVVRIVWQHQSGFWDGSAHISIWYWTSTRFTVRSYSRSCWTVQPTSNSVYTAVNQQVQCRQPSVSEWFAVELPNFSNDKTTLIYTLYSMSAPLVDNGRRRTPIALVTMKTKQTTFMYQFTRKTCCRMVQWWDHTLSLAMCIKLTEVSLCSTPERVHLIKWNNHEGKGTIRQQSQSSSSVTVT